LALVGAQFLFAVGYAFLSGTDTTFHFDTLDGAGWADEFERREAVVRRGLLIATAGSAVIGGSLAFVDLRLPFVASLIVTLVQFAATTRMSEPPRTNRSEGVRVDLATVLRSLRRPLLAWVTLYVVTEVILIHLVSELTPPYLAMVLERPDDDPAGAAVIAGAVAAVVALAGAAALRHIETARVRLGVGVVLVALALSSAATVLLMANVASLWVLPAVALRGVQAAATSVLVPGLVARRVAQHHRATTLSVTSLAGRCGYAAVLLALAAAAGDQLPDVLELAAAVAIVTAAVTLGAALLPPIARELRREREAAA